MVPIKPGRPPMTGKAYDWPLLFSKKSTLRQGKHYLCRTDTMAQTARMAFIRMRKKKLVKGMLSVSISPDGKSLTMKVVQ